MSLYDIIRDELGRYEVPADAELEFRIPVPGHVLDTVRALYSGARPCVHTETMLQYNDQTDVRCVDGAWERKRNICHTRMPSPVRCSLVLSVESPALPPPGVRYTPLLRERWSYDAGSDWRVDFTRSERSSNIEVEYIGTMAALSGSLCGLELALDAVLAHVAFGAMGTIRCAAPATVDMPFVRIDLGTSVVRAEERRALVRLMQRSQPVSMPARSPALECPLVSVKYDGVRVVLCVRRWRGHWYAVGVCRRGWPWCVPCLTASMDMVLDCEYVHATRTFVAFDVFGIRGAALAGDYRQRLRALAGVQLPVLAGIQLERKTVYPLCVLTRSWYDERAAEAAIDGIIVHNGCATLDKDSTMYKWKPEHTVDLYVGSSCTMMDGSYTAFLALDDRVDVPLAKGDVWECAFTHDGTRVLPLRRRVDKPRANARHVCREILKAHRDDLSITDVCTILSTTTAVVRSSKRKRGP